MIVLDSAKKLIDRYPVVENGIITQSDKEYMEQISRESVYYREDLPRILLFGRYKAGKSALINALLGRELAVVGPREKTAWVARYYPANRDFCYVYTKIGETIEYTIDQFLNKCKENPVDFDFFNNVSRVDIGVAGLDLPFALIDSPGYGTVNQDNLKRALSSLNDADFLLYTVDVRNLGKQYDYAVISEVLRQGFPAACVATKYDGNIVYQFECDPNIAIASVAKYTPFDKNNIYLTSAQTVNTDEQSRKWMNQVLTLCKQVSIRKSELRDRAKDQYELRVCETTNRILTDMEYELEGIQNAEKKYKEELHSAANNVTFHMEREIRAYITSEYLKEYRDQIKDAASDFILNGDYTENNFNELLNRRLLEILPTMYNDQFWQQLSEYFSQKYYSLWKRYNDDVTETMAAWSLEQENVVMDLTSSLDDDTSIQKVRTTANKVAIGVGGFAAFYEAVLGANAASLVLAGTTFTVGIPIAAVGMVVSKFVVGRYKKERKSQEIKDEIDKGFNDQINEMVRYCVSKLDDMNASVIAMLIEAYKVRNERGIPSSLDLARELTLCRSIKKTISDFIREAKERERVRKDNYDAPVIHIVDETDAELEKMKKEIQVLRGTFRGFSERVQASTDKMIREYEDRLGQYSNKIKEYEDQTQAFADTNPSICAGLEKAKERFLEKEEWVNTMSIGVQREILKGVEHWRMMEIIGADGEEVRSPATDDTIDLAAPALMRFQYAAYLILYEAAGERAIPFSTDDNKDKKYIIRKASDEVKSTVRSHPIGPGTIRDYLTTGSFNNDMRSLKKMALQHFVVRTGIRCAMESGVADTWNTKTMSVTRGLFLVSAIDLSNIRNQYVHYLDNKKSGEVLPQWLKDIPDVFETIMECLRCIAKAGVA